MSGAAHPSTGVVWREIFWQRPLASDRCLALLRQLASQSRQSSRAPLVLEARAESTSAGARVRYLVGASSAQIGVLARQCEQLVPGTRLLPLPQTDLRRPITLARQVKLSTRHRALSTAEPTAATRAILTAMTAVRSIHAAGDEHGKNHESVVLQLILGPALAPMAVATRRTQAITAPWWSTLWLGNSGALDSEQRTALRNKVGEHGFACSLRIGAHAGTPARQRQLILGVLAALRTSESAGVRLRHRSVSARYLNEARLPLLAGLGMAWSWPLRLNVSEVLAVSGWPVTDKPNDAELPGLPALHPRPLPPTHTTRTFSAQQRVIGLATAPGYAETFLAQPASAALHHTHVLGPTGVGKSVLLGRLIEQDIRAGRGVVVVEPKGDLVDDVLARIPTERSGDVVVLDPTSARPVGLNPLVNPARSPEVIADGMLSVFRALYADSWGPRLQDVLHAGLLTLTRQAAGNSGSHASLVHLPLLFTNPVVRRRLLNNISDPIALEPFWAWFDQLSDAERTAVISPVMNKLRPWLLNSQLRAVIGQASPRFQLSQLFTSDAEGTSHQASFRGWSAATEFTSVASGGVSPSIVLVPLRCGVMGDEAARLLGSLVVAQLWQAIQGRAGLPAKQRHPIGVYIDEVQDYLHLPTDLGNALAQARGLGVGFTLAHQFLGQLSPQMKAGVLANARSRVCFQLAHDDATVMAKGHPELAAEDFTNLGAYEVYASLFTDGRVTPYASARTMPADEAISSPAQLKQASAERFGRDIADIESEFTAMVGGPGTEKYSQTDEAAELYESADTTVTDAPSNRKRRSA